MADVLVVDNHDSFVHTLVGYLHELGATTRMVEADAVVDPVAEVQGSRGILVSPGPGRPEDAGASIDVVRTAAARGIIDIVNENMFGALRMISVQQGYDPRDFALMGFGGAGPLHVNAVARLMGSWPAVSPVSPGVLCALGDATTRMRTETARSFSRLAEA